MKFSIVTPSLNQGPWISDALTSVRISNQNPIEVGHWVIDGGSTDKTRDVLAGQDFARWISEPDRGQTDAINKGFARCEGDIFGYLCADDFYEPGALARVAVAFRDNPEVDVVYGDGYFLESDSGWKRRKVAGPFSWPRLRRNNFLIQPAVFWRRQVWDQFGPFDATLRFCMDHDYWLRIGESTRWEYLPEPLATSRLHANAKTSSALAAAWWEAVPMQARHGIVGKPRRDAIWMTLGGQHYYRLKRLIFSWWGKRRRPAE